MDSDNDFGRRLLSLEKQVSDLEGYRVSSKMVLCHLIISLAKQTDDPHIFLREILQIGDRLLGPKTVDAPDAVFGAESIRADLSWIVQKAREALR